jgi:pimeloyl-ACP methyl ester carboxylesterase
MSDFQLPETHYAQSGDVSIAYQVMGEGPIDLIMVPGFISHIEFQHELAGYTAFLRRLSSFARVVTFDKRGQGLSDRTAGAPSLEVRMDDVRAIMDAIGSRRAALLGISEGGLHEHSLRRDLSRAGLASHPDWLLQPLGGPALG